MADPHDKHSGNLAANDAQGSTSADTPADSTPLDNDSHDQRFSRLRAGRERFRQRGIYLLPNLITTAALFAGFYAIVAGINADFVQAALAIFVAMALDTADGRVARMTSTESEFGAQFDSLSDMVAFGVAPALVAFFWGVDSLGKVGWVVTFLYMACAALRLARFNTSGENSSFTGLASPSAAAIVACCVWVWMEYAGGQPSPFFAGCMGTVLLATALLMVSNFPYFSPKMLGVSGRVPFVTLVLVVLGFALLLLDPPVVLLVLFTVYALSGPVLYVKQLWFSKPATPEGDNT